MSTNTSMALIHLDQRAHELQMRLVRGSLSDPAPGRTLNQVYSHVGDYIGMQVNRAAHRWGKGPSATADRIAEFFGTGQRREAKLEVLQVDGCPWLEEECAKLIKYTLPSETAGSQIQAFKSVVTIVTRYHSTRELFLKSKHLRRAGNTEALISAVWARADDTQPREWDYYCRFAAACLSEQHISLILGNISPRYFGSIDTGSGNLSVIERLLIASESSAGSISDALALRYLVGVLELPAFWRESGAIHITVFTKILDRVTCLLTDLGLDSGKDESEVRNGIILDNEGIDSMANVILVGVLDWHTTDPEPQYWYRSLTGIVRLLRLPRAERLLPTSSALATGPDVGNIIPDPVPDRLDILTMANNAPEIQQTCEPDHISLRSLGDELDEWVEDLDVAPTIVYTEAVSFRWTTIGSALFSARRWSLSRRKKVQVNEPLSRAWFPGWLRGFLARRNRHGRYATPSETTTEDTSTIPDSDHRSPISESGTTSTRTFFLNIAPLVSAENPFAVTCGPRPSITPRRTISNSTVPARSIPLTPALVTVEEDEARVKMVLEIVADRQTQEKQPPGELGRQKHLLEQTVNACLDDYEHSSTAPDQSHELAVAGQNVVAQAAEYIVRKAAPGAVVLPNHMSAMQNVNTEELVETTKDAIAEAVKETRGTSEIDELSILLIACRVLDGALRPAPQQLWADHSPPTLHMPPPLDWYVPAHV